MASVANASTSICGIDVGTENCYIAVARQGGIEILLNEYSQRSTPSYVGFGGNQRELGVSAKQKQMMNLANTCVAPTLIIGKKFNELNLKDIPYNVQEGENGEPVIPVHHNDVDLVLTPTQVLAMLFTKLRHIAGNVVDCVINCPNYFNETQKRALVDAAHIAGLNPLKVIPDLTAIALYYGFYRSSAASGQDFSVVSFVDCGQTSTQVSVVLFNHKENTMHVLDAEYQPNVGGKNFDEILAEHFIEEKKLRLNKRARCRLIAECEKLKKQMSANSNELPINIECLYEDRDFSARIDRAKFEELAKEEFDKIKGMLTLALLRATEKYNKDFAEKFGTFKVDSVEIVGGTSRIPAIKRMIKDIFAVEPSTTLNADEAVARGCALQCAILSPTFKVAKELSILDSLPYQINFRYSIGDGNGEFKAVHGLYPRGHQYPFTKQISLSCPALPVTAAFDYVNDNNEIVHYAQFSIREKTGTNASEHLSKSPIKLRVRIDKNGLVLIPSASVAHEIEVEEVVEPKNEEPMDVDGTPQAPNENSTEAKPQEQQQPQPQQNAAEEPKKKMKSKTVTIDLDIIPTYIAGKLAPEKLQQFLEIESNLILADKNWKEKTDAKNALEEYIYEWRDRLESGSYDEFIQGNEKADFRAKLEENEQWLNQQDEEELMHSKSVYDERTNGMKTAFSERFLYRKREAEERIREAERKAAQEAAELLKQQQQQQQEQENAQNGQQESPVEPQQTGGDQQADTPQPEQPVEPMNC